MKSVKSLAIDIGQKNFSWSYFSKTNVLIDFDDVDLTQFSKLRKIKTDSTTITRVKTIIQLLTELFEKFEIDTVIVERQVKTNVVCKSIESTILTFSIIKGKQVKIYNPTDKFKYLNPSYDSKKKEHKKIVQGYAVKILNHYKLFNQVDKFITFKKRDDISDSICMAVFTNLSDNEVIKILTE